MARRREQGMISKKGADVEKREDWIGSVISTMLGK